MIDKRHRPFRFPLLAGLAVLAAIVVPALPAYAQTTATLYTDGTNFGIGTTGPTQKLQVAGTIAATAFSGDGSGLTNVANSSGWTDGGTNVYTTTTTDNVGIGTTTPNAATLEIVKNAAQPALKISSTTTGSGDFLIVDSAGNIGIGTTKTTTSGMSIMNGNVGMGTTVPSDLLHIHMMPASSTSNIRIGEAGGSLLMGWDASANTGVIESKDYSGGTFDLNVLADGMSISAPSYLRLQANVGIGTITPLGALTVINGNVGIGTWNPVNALSVKGNIGIGTTLPYLRISAPNNGMVVEGNVGIGTWSPTQALQVVGTVSATAFVGDGSGLTNVANSSGWTDGGANVYTTTTTDNVGIGTTTPIMRLLVVESGVVPEASAVASGAAMISVQGNGAAYFMGRDVTNNIEYIMGTSTLGTVFAGSMTNHRLDLRTNNINRFSIDTSGNVGIGTTAPVGGLTVMAGNAGIGTWSPTQALQVVGTVSATAFVGDGSGLTNVANSSGWTDGGTNVYTSTTTDNVGIGTTTPTAALLIENAGSQASFRVNDAVLDASPFIIDATGNIGVGTFAPQGLLELQFTASGNVLILDGHTGTDQFIASDNSGQEAVSSNISARIGFLDDVGTHGAHIAFTTNGTGGASTTQAERMRITRTGNVGIGTAEPLGGFIVMNGNAGIGTWSPTQALQVVGTVSATAFVGDGSGLTNVANSSGWTDGGTNVYASATTDLVAVGTTTPASTLTIVGNLGIGTTTPYRTIAGPVNGIVAQGNVGLGTWAASDKLIVLGGNVGIGTNAPARQLEVADSGVGVDIYGISGNSAGYVMSKGGDLMLGPQGSNQLVLYSSGISQIIGNLGVGTNTPLGALTVMNGNAGIGTWIPSQKLQVVGTVSATAFVGDGSGLTGISAGGWSDGGTNVYTTATTDNVGIGTTTPLATLEVENVGTGDSFLVNDSLLDASPFVINSSGNVGIGTHSPNYKLSVSGGTLNVAGSGGSENDSGTLRIGNGSSGPFTIVGNAGTGNIIIDNTNSSGGDITIRARGTSVFFIDGSTKNVGIGTTSPTVAVLNVNGEIYAAGQVGIGTFTPTGMMDIRQDEVRVWTGAGTDTNATSAGELYVEGDLEVDGTIYGDGSGLTSLPSGVSAGGWTDGGTNVYTSTTTDLVAIGTTTPVSTLTVRGNVGIGTTTPYTTIAAPANGMVVEGNVGIGTWAANGKLIVMGGNVGIGTANLVSFVQIVQPNAAGSMSKAFSVQGGSSTSGNGTGSDISLIAGNGNGSGAGGQVYFRSGFGNNGPGAVFQMAGGDFTGASITLTPGTSAGGGGGPLLLYGGSGGISGDQTGGDITLQAGAGNSAYDGGDINIDGGSAGGTGAVGNVYLANARGMVGIGTTTPVAGLAVMNGNVGIGTWSPTQRLQVVGTVSATAFVGDGSGLTNVANSSGWTDGGTNVYTSATTDLVAVGTTTPASALTVKGNIGIGTTTPYTTIAAPVNGMIVEGSVGIGTFAASGGKLVVMGGNVGVGTTTPVGAFTVMNGNVGVGTWSPRSKLEATDGTSNVRLSYNTGGNYYGVYANGGECGGAYCAGIYADTISNSSTAAIGGFLNLSNADGIGLFLTSDTVTTGRLAYFSHASSAFTSDMVYTNMAAGSGSFTGKFLNFQKNSVTQFSVNNNGNVGIGTVNPVNALSVMGNIGIGTTTPYRFIPGPGNGLVAEGNVGIGTWAADSGKLIVAGGNVGIGTTTPVGAFAVMNGNVGIGTWSPTSGMQMRASFAVHRASTAANATTAGQTIIGVTDTSAARTVTLASADAVAGRIIIIKDESGGAGTNNITIETQGGKTIDGAASIAITVNYGVLRVYSDGTNWFTF